MECAAEKQVAEVSSWFSSDRPAAQPQGSMPSFLPHIILYSHPGKLLI